MPTLYPKYERLMSRGEYESVEEMCNDLGLNYDDVYDYSDLEARDNMDRFENHQRSSTARNRKRR